MLFIHKHALYLSLSLSLFRGHTANIVYSPARAHNPRRIFVSYQWRRRCRIPQFQLITSTWNHYPNFDPFVLRQSGNAGIRPTSTRRKSSEAEWRMAHFAFHIASTLKPSCWRRCYFSLSLNSLAATILSGPQNKANLFTISSEPPSSERDFYRNILHIWIWYRHNEVQTKLLFRFHSPT